DADVVTAADPGSGEVVGQAIGAIVELRVRQPPAATGDRRAFRDGAGDGLEEVGEVELHRCRLAGLGRAAEQLTDPEQLQGAATEGQLELLRPQEVAVQRVGDVDADPTVKVLRGGVRSEEHTSELQSPCNLVCRLLLEKKKARTSPSAPFPRSSRRPPSRPCSRPT